MGGASLVLGASSFSALKFREGDGSFNKALIAKSNLQILQKTALSLSARTPEHT